MADEADVTDDTQNVPEDGADDAKDEAVAKTEDIEKLKEQNTKLFERAKKAEGFVKQADGTWLKKPKPELKPEPQPEVKSNNAASLDPVELAKTANVLSGMSDKEIENLQLIAKAKNISFSEAKKDPLFQTWQTKFQEDEKKEQNKLGGSRGSGQVDEEESDFKPGMSREDHEKKVKEMMGK